MDVKENKANLHTHIHTVFFINNLSNLLLFYPTVQYILNWYVLINMYSFDCILDILDIYCKHTLTNDV